MQPRAPLVLIILDGFGCSDKIMHNAIAKTHMPHWENWWKNNPHTLIEASGERVGLPAMQMGNSEVGHMHIGAGRLVPQDFTRINQAIAGNELASNSAIQDTLKKLTTTHRTLHLMGLLSPGGVHSHEEHLFGILKLCEQQKFDNIRLHLFLDGRDTPPKIAIQSLEKLQQHLQHTPNIQIDSIAGRFYAMDRDKRWDRIEPVYQLLTTGQSEYAFPDPIEAVEFFYQQDIFDEFIPPTRIGEVNPIQNKDAIFFFNFRADRARELTDALISKAFEGFHREKVIELAAFLSMTQYAEHLATTPVFPPLTLNNTLGEVLAAHQLRQLRVAETEKYAHVTFFLNGGAETVFPYESRSLIPSPQVKTYDLQPEMSAPQVTQVILDAITQKTHDVIICNYANADMVGHTGNFNATSKAIACLDKAMGKIAKALASVNGQMLITADHGNAELMFNNKTKLPHTAHTTNPVPLLYVGPKNLQFKPHIHGSLIDIAPTVLFLLDITPPHAMTGQNLLEHSAEQ